MIITMGCGEEYQFISGVIRQEWNIPDPSDKPIEFMRNVRDLIPKLSDFLLDLHRALAHQGFVKILNISTGMPVVFANPYASRSQHISSQ